MLYQSFYAQDGILREINPSFKISPFLTNKEALTVLCSVRCKARTTGSGQNTKEVQGGTRDVVECFSLLLDQNRIELSQDFFNCFMNTVSPLLRPPGRLFFFNHLEGGLNREGSLKASPVAKVSWYETEQTYPLYNYSHCQKYLIHLWEPKSNKNKILILQKCAFGLMFFGNFYENGYLY